MRGVEWYFILWSSPGNVEILLCTWSFSFTCTFSFLCTLDAHVVMHLLLFIPAEKGSVRFFKCLQAWPDIITGSTVEPDVVYFCLCEKLLALQVKTQLFHCSVDKLRHQTGNWLSHELCEVVCMQLALCITEQVSYNLGAANLVKIDLWSIRGMGRTRIGLGHHLSLWSGHGNHSVSGEAMFQLEKINLHMWQVKLYDVSEKRRQWCEGTEREGWCF